MGFASYVEDMIDRLNDAMYKVNVQYNEKKDTEQQYRASLSIQQQCEELLLYVERELYRNLELATDPKVDLAHELMREKKSNSELQNSVDAKMEEIEKLNRELSKKNNHLDILRKKLYQVDKEKNDFVKSVENIGSIDYFYDKYGPGSAQFEEKLPEQFRQQKSRHNGAKRRSRGS